MTSSAAIFGTYFILFLVVISGAQEVLDEVNEGTDTGTEGTIPTLNVTNTSQVDQGTPSSSLNTTTEERPSKCKEILKSFVDESVNTVSCTKSLSFRSSFKVSDNK